jgi:hypothetical protein
MIFVFVGTDLRSYPADLVLEHSIRRHTTEDVSIEWMRAGKGEFAGWRMDNHDLPYTGQGWATLFTCFRYAVPELMGCQGRAIYLDSDMLVLGDIAKLWRCGDRPGPPWRCVSPHQEAKRTDVSVINCGDFAGAEWWPSMAKMKRSGMLGVHYRQILKEHRFIASDLPAEWNCLDAATPGAKLVHFTSMGAQPWRPWPEVFGPDAMATLPDGRANKRRGEYPTRWPFSHDQAAGVLWWHTYEDALLERVGAVEAKAELLRLSDEQWAGRRT